METSAQAYIDEVPISNYGAVLIRGWREALLKMLKPKDYISNVSRTEHGKRMLIPSKSEVYYSDRDVQLKVFIEGTTAEDYIQKIESFQEAIRGTINLRIPSLNNRVYVLVYLDCKSYGNYGDKRGIFTLAFNEPNPMYHPTETDTETTE